LPHLLGEKLTSIRRTVLFYLSTLFPFPLNSCCMNKGLGSLTHYRVPRSSLARTADYLFVVCYAMTRDSRQSVSRRKNDVDSRENCYYNGDNDMSGVDALRGTFGLDLRVVETESVSLPKCLVDAFVTFAFRLRVVHSTFFSLAQLTSKARKLQDAKTRGSNSSYK